MATFNADQLIASIEHPRLTLNGKTYVGRILSADEFMPFAPRFEELRRGKMEFHAVYRLCHEFFLAVFPPGWWQHVRRKTVADELLRQPPMVVQQALADFLRSQARYAARAGDGDGTASRET